MMFELLADGNVDALRDLIVLLLLTIVNSLKAVVLLDHVFAC